jgi:hypothetical protein
LKVPWIALSFAPDRRDVPVADLLQERGVVGDLDPRCAVHEGRREDVVEREHREEERHGAPVQPPFLVAVGRCVALGNVAFCGV